ncbi:MAG: MCE family protein [Alphaproteobacteria bacterium]|nr:MCE family protein [Alphaproteobacteria bacterium]
MITKGGNRDIVTGALVVASAALVLAVVYLTQKTPGESDDSDGYLVTARFSRLDGIAVGSPVRLSGLPVGKVAALSLAPDFRAVTSLRIRSDVQLPSDTAAAIHTDGLLGSKFVVLQPGAEESVLASGQEIPFTQDSMVIEDLMEMIIQQGRAKRGYLDRPLPSISN